MVYLSLIPVAQASLQRAELSYISGKHNTSHVWEMRNAYKHFSSKI
jgi:hypothetical protein